jgi:hypothetical protein
MLEEKRKKRRKSEEKSMHCPGFFIINHSKTLIAQVFEVSYFSAQLILDLSQDFNSFSKFKLSFCCTSFAVCP